MKLAERYPGIPVFRFGSQALAEFHEGKWSEYTVPVERTQMTYLYTRHYTERERIRVANRCEQYIVDHGGFFTLNTLRAGQCAVDMKDIRNEA